MYTEHDEDAGSEGTGTGYKFDFDYGYNYFLTYTNIVTGTSCVWYEGIEPELGWGGLRIWDGDGRRKVFLNLRWG